MQICIGCIHNIIYSVEMQFNDEKNLQFLKAVGRVIKKLREEKTGLSCREFAYSYDIEQTTLNRIENGKHNAAFYYIWGILEALDISFAEFETRLKKELGKDFTLIDK